jgi:uncharacterized membrane protein
MNLLDMNLSAWQIFVLSALPITELRVTIPLALANGMSVQSAFLLAVAGNFLPIGPLLFGLEMVSSWLRRFRLLDALFQKILLRTRQKGREVQRYGPLGLMIFVAIPLPGTGAWSGAILAWLLGLTVLTSAVAISAGVIIAGIIVSLASIGMIQFAGSYGIEYLLAAVIVIAVLYFWQKRKKKD